MFIDLLYQPGRPLTIAQAFVVVMIRTLTSSASLCVDTVHGCGFVQMFFALLETSCMVLRRYKTVIGGERQAECREILSSRYVGCEDCW